MSFGDDTLDPVVTYTQEQVIKGIELAQQWYEGQSPQQSALGPCRQSCEKSR